MSGQQLGRQILTPERRRGIVGEFTCCSTTISSLYLSRFQVIITDIVCPSPAPARDPPGLSRLVTLLGRENKLISSKVDIDAEGGRGGREGGRGE